MKINRYYSLVALSLILALCFSSCDTSNPYRIDPHTGLPTTGVNPGLLSDNDDNQELASSQGQVDPPPQPDPDPAKIVEVITGGNHGIHVRDPAGLHMGEDNIIGHMHKGMRGEIIGGPKEVSGLTWWHIQWFDGDCEINKRVPCIGWSAEFHTDGTRLLKFVE